MLPALEGLYGNPSSIHQEGRRSRDALEGARADVARLISAEASEIVFTSGGTESDLLGIVGAARAARETRRPARIVTSPVEHPAVFGACDLLRAEGFEISLVPVDARGRIDLDDVKRACSSFPGSGPGSRSGSGIALASFALANHELGNRYDVRAFAEITHAAGGLFHCDAVQAVGKIPVSVAGLGVDFLSLSAHKLHGPKGVGALWVRRGLDPIPLFPGGHQEKGRRAGTENLAGALGFGAAARLAAAADETSLAALRDCLEARLLEIPGARIHGDPEQRVPNTTNVAFAGAPGEWIVVGLDFAGVAASTGAACTSGSVEPSRVLLALGLDRTEAAQAVRFSLGRGNTQAEVDSVSTLVPEIVARVRAEQRS